MKKEPINIVWLRRDLRLDDQAAIYRALTTGLPVLPVFIFDPDILKPLPKLDYRVQFIFETLSNLKTELEEMGSTLLTFHDKPNAAFKKLTEQFEIKTVFTNHDYEPSAIARDAEIKELLRKKEIGFETFKDQVIFEKKEVVKDDNKPYTVFTPYKKKWLKNLSAFYLKPYPCKKYFKNWAKKPRLAPWVTLKEMGFESDSNFQFPKETPNKETLKTYGQTRDFPALDSTSHLGLHLRFGTVSIRHLATVAKETNEVWLSELVWRDFFMQILFHFPHVVKESFRPEYDRIEWRNNKDEFKAWCEGRTGYPFVDAGMRELNATGYMHNRVRMVTASFLTKHLLIDWRWGERYFAEKLLDYDLSANNGNWQWAAGTGCDAAPYFRVFNPEIQCKKFDKNLEYTKLWVPELGSNAYPEPIVEHTKGRDRALNAYKKALKASKP